MHAVFALLCFVVVIHRLIFPYPSGLLHWHCGNLTIAPVPAKQPWWIWINAWCEFIMNDCITTTKQSTTKPCAYFLGYTVYDCINLLSQNAVFVILTHWGRVTHICVGKLTIIGSDNGLSPDRRQAIIWTNAGLLFIGPLGTNFSEILIEILTFSFKKMHLKLSSAKRRPFCPGLNVLTHWGQIMHLCISRLGHHWFTVLLDICLAPSHYLNQCRIIVDWITGNVFCVCEICIKIQQFTWKKIYFENVVWQMAGILSLPRCVDFISMIMDVLLPVTCMIRHHSGYGLSQWEDVTM